MSATALKTKQRPWGLTLVMGVMAMVIGAVLLWGQFNVKKELYMLLVMILGVYWLVDGVVQLVSIFQDHSMWGWKLFIGVVSMIAGAAILMYPVAAAVTLPKIFVLVLGIWGLMEGVVLLIMAFSGGGWAAGILGALGIIFGFALILNYTSPGMGLAMLWVAAVSALIGGGMMIFQAFKQRSA